LSSPQIEGLLKIGRLGLKKGVRLNRLSSSSFSASLVSKLDLKFNNSLMLDVSDRWFHMTMDRLGVELSYPHD